MLFQQAFAQKSKTNRFNIFGLLCTRLDGTVISTVGFAEAICCSFAWCYFVLVFFSPLSIGINSLGEERANLSAFHTFVQFAFVWCCLFPLLVDV